MTERDSAELSPVLERLEKEDFMLTEYDDVAVRQLVERVTVEDKDTITMTFKGGFEVREFVNLALQDEFENVGSSIEKLNSSETSKWVKVNITVRFNSGFEEKKNKFVVIFYKTSASFLLI